MQKKSDTQPLLPFEMPEPTTTSSARSTETLSSGGTGQTLTEIISENLEYGVTIPVIDDYESQLDFDALWQDKLRKKYGIRNALD